MSSINPSEYVLLDTNAENATLTPLQTTPSLTPSDSPSPALPPVRPTTSTATTSATTTIINNTNSTIHMQGQQLPTISGIQSYESFARELELKRAEWYLEAAAVSKCTDDEVSEATNSEKASALLAQLYPSPEQQEENTSVIFSIRISRYFLKYSKPEWALSLLSIIPVSTDTNTRSLPSSLLLEKEDRITYWYYKSLATLELQHQQSSSPQSITATNGTEDLIKNGMIEAVGCINEDTRKKWINVGYFLMAVYSLLRGDEIDARFWKGQLPAGYTLPEGVYCTHEGLVEGLGGLQMPVMRGGARGEMGTPRPAPAQSTSSSEGNRDVISQLQGLTTADIAMRDVARLKRDVSDIYDSVNMNYREMHERIKAIHTILDGGKGGVSREEVDELKKRLGYLEGVALRG
ncbi:hypothetical protein TWF730_003616 [Orbilia blumenaviensis]|uniref:Uncharacterized protein n=1 Tax=Orbilia blumenaviensis TaxID=1796055 RepID=A0AAV9U2X5_9PEZI